ncbi:hypothetical protein ASD15_01770 [Massilia sp. Root351]|jgi:hypothetical protein|uniref:hypothetical protein n=1 Tax=Massilia sp. Root351 TaxID=1736522 RepID=UPI00070A4E94|nr:hypothetical protein [Massilia sp. Root351]KQV90823.1 hypothetical protein ASD15_01770 [Massilia sp. Root351]
MAELIWRGQCLVWRATGEADDTAAAREALASGKVQGVDACNMDFKGATELLLERLADDGSAVAVTLRPTRKEGRRVVTDRDAAALTVTFASPILYQVMEEAVAAMHGLRVPDERTVLCEMAGNAYIDGLGLEQLRPGVRYFLLRTAHSVVWAACAETPALS